MPRGEAAPEYVGHWWGEKPPIRCVVHIRRSSSGVTRDHEDDFYGDFIWSEGNYACDCNRAIFFAVDDKDDDHECGDSAFVIQIVAKDDGRLLYEDADWDCGGAGSVRLDTPK